jgi:hypothetical protein
MAELNALPALFAGSFRRMAVYAQGLPPVGAESMGANGAPWENVVNHISGPDNAPRLTPSA